MERTTRRQLLGGLTLAALALVGLLVFSPERVLTRLAGLGERPLLFAVGLIVLYSLRPLVLWPISALSILVGFVLGPTVGIPVALAGAVYTCLPPYLLARYAPGSGGPLERARALGERAIATTGDFRGVAAARLLPLPADPVSYAAGLAGVSLPTYVVATGLGETLWVVAAVVTGSSMRTLTVGGAGGTLPLVVGAAALGLLLLGGPTYRHLRGEAVPNQ